MNMEIPENYVPVRFLFPEKISAKIDFEMERIYKFAKANMISIKEVPNYIFTKYANSTQNLSKISIDLPDFIIKLAYKNQTFIKVSQETQEADDSGQWQKSLWAGILSFIPGVGSLVSFTNMFRSSYPKCAASKATICLACAEFLIDVLSSIADIISLVGIFAAVPTAGTSLSLTIGAGAAKIAAPVITAMAWTGKLSSGTLKYVSKYLGTVFSILEKLFRWVKRIPGLSKASKAEGWMKTVKDFFMFLADVLEKFYLKCRELVLATGSLPDAEKITSKVTNLANKAETQNIKLIASGGKTQQATVASYARFRRINGSMASGLDLGAVHLTENLCAVVGDNKVVLARVDKLATGEVFLQEVRAFNDIEIKNNPVLKELITAGDKAQGSYIKYDDLVEYLTHDKLSAARSVHNVSPLAQTMRNLQTNLPKAYKSNPYLESLIKGKNIGIGSASVNINLRRVLFGLTFVGKLGQFSLNFSEQKQKQIAEDMAHYGSIVHDFIKNKPTININDPELRRTIERQVQIAVSQERQKGDMTPEQLEEYEILMRKYLYELATKTKTQRNKAKPNQRGYGATAPKRKETSNTRSQTRTDDETDSIIPDIVVPEI